MIKNCKCDPLLCHKLSHLLGPLSLESDVLYGRPLETPSSAYFRRHMSILFARGSSVLSIDTGLRIDSENNLSTVEQACPYSLVKMLPPHLLQQVFSFVNTRWTKNDPCRIRKAGHDRRVMRGRAHEVLCSAYFCPIT